MSVLRVRTATPKVMFNEDETCSMIWGQLDKEKRTLSQEQNSTCRGLEARERVTFWQSWTCGKRLGVG